MGLMGSQLGARAQTGRRTQEERRTHTRKLLLDATVASLGELGYAGTTTLEVERRAGVSRGARIHHFESKAALLAGALAHLYDELAAQYQGAFAPLPGRRSDRQRVRAGLHTLWAIYQRAHFTAVLELSAAARRDPELTDQLRIVAAHHRDLALHAGTVLFPGVARVRIERCVETINAAFIGLRTTGGITTTQHHVELVLSALEDLVMSHLKAAAKEQD
jgi:AcrR family transcriptional regulator